MSSLFQVSLQFTWPYPAETDPLEKIRQLAFFASYRAATLDSDRLSLNGGKRGAMAAEAIFHQLAIYINREKRVLELTLSRRDLPWLRARNALFLAQKQTQLESFLAENSTPAPRTETKDKLAWGLQRALISLLSILGANVMTILACVLYGLLVMAGAQQRTILEVLLNARPESALIIGTVLALPLGPFLALCYLASEYWPRFGSFLVKINLATLLFIAPLLFLEHFMFSSVAITCLIPAANYLGYSIAQSITPGGFNAQSLE